MTEQTDAAEYTPTTQEVRSAYVMARYETEGVNNPQLYAEFARWLAAREAAARAEALREAAEDVQEECRSQRDPCFCGSANWLRDRADSIARTDGAGS